MKSSGVVGWGGMGCNSALKVVLTVYDVFPFSPEPVGNTIYPLHPATAYNTNTDSYDGPNLTVFPYSL